MSEALLRTRIFGVSVQIDKKKDVWTVRCPKCHSIFQDRRHGYSSSFPTGLYFQCPHCGTSTTAPHFSGNDSEAST
jgi:uncharacterized C2H2 Zn-finger protein